MDERKKKMLMIGGVVALAVVVIIVAAVIMDHKKKVEQSPMIVQTTTGAIIVPATTKPPRLYLKSKTGMYFVCDEGKRLAVSANMADATPLNIIKCKDTDGYCLFSKDNKAISISGSNIVGDPSGYLLYISSISNTAYIAIVGEGWLFDQTSLGFTGTSVAGATVWNVVSG